MFTFFFHETSPFSQWYRCTFVADGLTFTCAEQYMMFNKARLFADASTGGAIMAASHPREHKELGRMVRRFDHATWERERERIVKDGNRAKFTQNPELLERLLATKGTRLVEASPTDLVWGIGLAETDPRATDPSQWRGRNLLGQILTELRDELLAA